MVPNRPIDMADPLQVAVKVTSIEGSLAVLTQQVSTGLGNLSSQVAAVQAEQRDQGKSLRDVAVTQRDMQGHSEGLERLARSMDRYSAEFASWRDKHEAENKGVAERVTTFKGVIIGFGILATVLASAMGYIVRTGFQRMDENIMTLDKQHESDLTKHTQYEAESRLILSNRVTRNEEEIEKLKATRGAR